MSAIPSQEWQPASTPVRQTGAERRSHASAPVERTLRGLALELADLREIVRQQQGEIQALLAARKGGLRTPLHTPYGSGIATILKQVAEHFGTTVPLIRSNFRGRPHVTARHVCMLLLVQRMPSTQAGRVLGGVHHTSVFYGARQADRLARGDRELARLVLQLSTSQHVARWEAFAE